MTTDINQKLDLFAARVRDASSIAIIAHNNPDGDALCSTLALARLIELNFDRHPVCVYDGNIPGYLESVPHRSDMHYWDKIAQTPFDLVIVVDTGARIQLADGDKIVAAARDLIEIDHHQKDGDPIAELNFNNPDAAATTEIIYDMMQAAQWTSDADVLNLLAVGILTDTGNFRFARRPRPLRIMAELMEHGVNPGHLMDMLSVNPRKAVLTEAAVTSRAEFFFGGRLALAIVDRADYKNLDGKGNIIMHLLGQIRGVEFVVVLKHQRPGQIGVSLRGRGVPVDDVARILGGGGHMYAAGAVVHDTLENVRARVIELFKEKR